MSPKIALLALICALPATSSHAAPAMQKILVGPSYLVYISSGNLDTLSMEKPDSRREKLGSPMSILFNGERLKREQTNGYATMFATWAQTTLRVPLGWYAVESNENVEESLVFSPGLNVAVVARAAIENQQFQSDRNAFAKLKAASVEQTRIRLQNLGFKPGPIERFDLADGSFAVRAPQMHDRDGEAFSYIELFSQRATKAERDAFWAKVAAKQPVAPLPLPLALSLRTTPAKLDKYVGLLGLMARDEGLNWAREFSFSPTEFNAQAPDADKFNAVADEAVALIRAGDAAAFAKRFPEAFEGQSATQTAKYLTQIAKPFFAKLPAKIEREQITVVRDRDPKTPLYRVTIRRDFKLSEQNFPTYVVAMERINGRIQLLGVATTDDPFSG